MLEIEFEIPDLSGEEHDMFGYYLGAPEFSRETTRNPIYNTVGKIWDTQNFKIPRIPIIIGEVFNKKAFAEYGVHRVLDMPIKFPGTSYRLPIELAQFSEVLNRIIYWEHALNWIMHSNYYAYLTVDHLIVEIGDTQRRAGYHVDGFQGARIINKTAINRSYVVSDNTPTVFSNQVFNVDHLNDTKHNFFLEFDRQAKEENEWRPEPYQIALMDAYTVHRADVAKETKVRTFLRLSYDVKKFDRLGNTHNPLFDYEWDMVPRNIQESLL